jgi:putative ABC transport system substrate-binding protein
VINGAALAIRKATSIIPVVCPLLIDPIKLGLANSYNRPDQNVTGVLQTVDTLPAKQVELLLQVKPQVLAIGALVNPTSSVKDVLLSAMSAAVRAKGLKFVQAEARVPQDIAPAIQILKQQNADSLIVLQDPLFFAEDTQINAHAQAAGIATMHGFRQNAEHGGLISYGVDIPRNFHRAAYFVDRILKGTRPGDLAIEFPVKLELVINMKVARALGLTVPSNLLFTADTVIE